MGGVVRAGEGRERGGKERSVLDAWHVEDGKGRREERGSWG